MSIYNWWLDADLLSDVSADLTEAAGKHYEKDKVLLKYQALEKLFNYHHGVVLGLVRRDTPAKKLNDMISSAVGLEEIRRICSSEGVRLFIGVRPFIKDMYLKEELSRGGASTRNQSVASSVIDTHNKADEAWNQYQEGLQEERPPEHRRLLQRLCRLLWTVIRGNVGHGFKNPEHPDQLKVERDRDICRRWLIVVDALLQVLLDCPEQRLAVYGPLRPHGSDHNVIADVTNEWSTTGSVEGMVAEKKGRQAFEWKRGNGESVNVHVLKSIERANIWSRMDDYDGPGYRRVLVPVNIGGKEKICSIYAWHPMQDKLGATH